jgi:branched-chain amino acid transport system substrate-binding protein
LIGSIEQITSAASPTPNTQGEDALNAWVKWTNTHGGINGHPVKVFIVNDQGDPAVGLSEAQTLVQSDHIIAMVGQTATITLPTWAPYILASRIPVVGGYVGYAIFYQNPMFYPVGSIATSNAWGQFKAAKEEGVKTVGILMCNTSPSCIAALPFYVAEAKANGLNVAFQQYGSPTQVSYTAQCLALKQAGAQGVVQGGLQSGAIVMAGNCAQQNYHPKWIAANDAPTVNTIKAAPALANTVGSAEHWNCQGPPTANTKDYYVAMKKYAPQWLVGTKLYNSIGNDNQCAAWDSAMTFQQAILNAHVPRSATASNSDVIRGLAQFQGQQVGGYTPPLYFSDGSKPNPQTYCAYLYKYQGTKLIPIPSTTGYTCEPDHPGGKP